MESKCIMSKPTQLRQSLRIVLAITAKDTLEAIKNHLLLMIFIGTLALLATASLMPFLSTVSAQPVLAIYAPGHPDLIPMLAEQTEIQVLSQDSEAQLMQTLVDAAQIMVGISVPSQTDFEAGDGAVHLIGYYANWADQRHVEEQTTIFQNALSLVLARLVVIDLDGNTVFPTSRQGYRLLMVTQTSVLMILLMGVMLVPYLFIAEKEQRTLSALLVSPASYELVIAGKALAGLVYSLIASAVLLLFYHRYIIHWEIIIAAILLGSCVAILVGLYLGIVIDNQATMSLWMGFALVLLLGPALLLSLGSTRLPGEISLLLGWTPGVALQDLLTSALLAPVDEFTVARTLGVLAVSALILYGMILWRIRQLDR